VNRDILSCFGIFLIIKLNNVQQVLGSCEHISVKLNSRIIIFSYIILSFSYIIINCDFETQ